MRVSSCASGPFTHYFRFGRGDVDFDDDRLAAVCSPDARTCFRFVLVADWRNDVEGLATLLSNHIPDYRNLMTRYSALKG